MKAPAMIERELDLVNQALAAASQLTGLQFTAEQAASLDDVRFDQMITFHGQGGKVRYAVEVVSKLTNANLGPVATRVRNLDNAGLLITPYMNRNLAEKLKALNIPFIVSLPGLAMLKLLAWNDRRLASTKDAQDLALLLRLYGDFARDRLFDSESDLMERHGFDLEMAGAELLGHDIGATASEATAPHLLSIMCGENRDKIVNEQLVRDVSRYLPVREYRNAETMLQCVVSGIEKGFISPVLNRPS